VRLDPLDDDGNVRAVIETPQGGRTKLGFDDKLGAFKVKKVLPEGMSFPFNFGFVPSTLEEDGDPLDVLVLMDEPLPTGTIVPSRLIGVIEAEQTEDDGETTENPRLIAVGDACVRYVDVMKLSDMPDPVVEQIEHFFVTYNREEGKEFKPTGRSGPKSAKACLKKSMNRYRRRH
jgi:inorganic pyrophosphatase